MPSPSEEILCLCREAAALNGMGMRESLYDPWAALKALTLAMAEIRAMAAPQGGVLNQQWVAHQAEDALSEAARALRGEK